MEREIRELHTDILERIDKMEAGPEPKTDYNKGRKDGKEDVMRFVALEMFRKFPFLKKPAKEVQNG